MAEHTSLHRRSIRLQDYDYAKQGAYFVTICTKHRESFFENTFIRKIAQDCWMNIPAHFHSVELDEWIVMPNHLHGILLLADTEINQQRNPANYFSKISPSSKTLAVVIRTYKAAVTTACRQAMEKEFAWQRNYFERIIRNEAELNRIRQYIISNPENWENDAENPKYA